MATTYPGLVHLNGNVLASIDYETTGRRAGYHEIIQVAIVPLNSDLRPMNDVHPFYTTVRPEYPERQETGAGYVHGLDINDLMLHSPTLGQVEEMLMDWWSKLDLPFGKKLTPLAHNWAFESSFTQPWIGEERMGEIYQLAGVRDAQRYALSLNDKSAFAGRAVPFNRVGLKSLALKFGVPNENPHDALNDALVEAEVYRSLLIYDLNQVQ